MAVTTGVGTSQQRISVGFSSSVQNRLDELARRHDRSIAWIVRKAVSFYLAKADAEQLALDLGSDDSY